MLARLLPVDLLQLAFHGLLLVRLILGWGGYDHALVWLAADVASLLVLATIIHFAGRMSLRQAGVLRVVHGAATVPVLFTQVGYGLRARDPYDFAPDLEWVDRQMCFGHNPIEALEALARPWLTELLQWSYALFVALPTCLALLFVWRGTTRFMLRSFFSLLGIIYLSYISYMVVPASGPNIHSNVGEAPCHVTPQPLYQFEGDLPGLWIAEPLRAWMFAAELTKWDCFPSGHVAVAVAGLVYGARLGRRWFFGLAPVCLGIIASTMYLRYHYVVDVVAGAALAGFGVTVLERWHRVFEAARWSAGPPSA